MHGILDGRTALRCSPRNHAIDVRPILSDPRTIGAALASPPAGHPAGYALFLDVDGTLLDIADDPDGVAITTTLIDLLAHLRRALEGALALISGRNLSTIDRFFAPHAFPAAGLHGLQVRNADGNVASVTADEVAMAELRKGVQIIAQSYPALRIEDKGGSLALHYRRAPELAATALGEARTLVATLGPAFMVQPGDHVVEIRPDGADKGQALISLMATPPFAGRVPVAIGDDLTDEHAFAAATMLGGIGVIVGERRPTRASHALAGPDAVRDWLRAVLARAGREPIQ